ATFACCCASARWTEARAKLTSQTAIVLIAIPAHVYCGSLRVVQNLFPCSLLIGYDIGGSRVTPLDSLLFAGIYQPQVIAGAIQKRRRHHGLVQRHVFMPRLRPFSCDESFHHGDRWPRQAETNRGGVLA